LNFVFYRCLTCKRLRKIFRTFVPQFCGGNLELPLVVSNPGFTHYGKPNRNINDLLVSFRPSVNPEVHRTLSPAQKKEAQPGPRKKTTYHRGLM